MCRGKKRDRGEREGESNFHTSQKPGEREGSKGALFNAAITIIRNVRDKHWFNFTTAEVNILREKKKNLLMHRQNISTDMTVVRACVRARFWGQGANLEKERERFFLIPLRSCERRRRREKAGIGILWGSQCKSREDPIRMLILSQVFYVCTLLKSPSSISLSLPPGVCVLMHITCRIQSH